MIADALAAASVLVTGATVVWRCDPDAAAPRIYFANHSSHLDFVVVWSALPADRRRLARPVAGRDYWERTAIRRYLAGAIFHAILIERSGGANRLCAAEASVERMAAEIDGGHSLIVFPEGTRRVDGQVGQFKAGLFHLSRLRPQVQLVPVYLENLHRILPKGEVLPVPMLSRVVFGPPLAQVRDEEKQPFLGRARDALIQLSVTS
jgi:1-acyl-sn-glycerol-3-phosphate acyltransferase